MDRFTLDDLATLTDDQALRRKFDSHNVRMVRWMLRFFLVVCLIQIPAAVRGTDIVKVSRTGPEQTERTARLFYPEIRLALTVVNLLGIALLLAAYKRVANGTRATKRPWLDRLAARLNRTLRGSIITYLAAQFLFLAAFSFFGGTKEPWFFIFPLLLLFFRFATAEWIFLFGLIVITGVVEAFVGTLFLGADFDSSFLIGVSISAAVLLTAALFLTNRSRSVFQAEWKEERDRAREQIRMRQELEFAREIQLSMLPREGPSQDWLDIAAVSLPATEVGGDYYDYFTTASGRLAVVIADVAGHGLASGIVLSGVRSCLTLLSEELDRPSEVMRKIHRMVQATSKHRMLVTLSILLFDRDRSKVILTSAGHPPLLRRQASGEVDEHLISSLPLGAGLPAGFAEHEIDFRPGDVFVLHTDGIYEMADENRNQYGIPRLMTVVGDVVEGNAQAMRDGIIGDLWTFKGDALQEDDITLVVIRIV